MECKMSEVVKTWGKPNYVLETDLVATKSGWCYTKNHNEVLVAVNHLDAKLAAQTPVDPDPEPEPETETPPEGEQTEP